MYSYCILFWNSIFYLTENNTLEIYELGKDKITKHIIQQNEVKNREIFFKLVRDSFTQKRKTLRNNLKAYDLDKISNVLAKYNFDLSVRAEQLPIEVFIDIANTLC